MQTAQNGRSVNLDLAVVHEVLNALDSCTTVLGEAAAVKGADRRLAGVLERAKAARQALVQQAPVLEKTVPQKEQQQQGEQKQGLVDKLFRRNFFGRNKRQQPAKAAVHKDALLMPAEGPAPQGTAGTFSVSAMKCTPVVEEKTRGATPNARKVSITEDDLIREVQITRVESQWIGGDCGCRRGKIAGHRCTAFCVNIGCDQSCMESQDNSRPGSRGSGSS